jgi:hypothetical protein
MSSILNDIFRILYPTHENAFDIFERQFIPDSYPIIDKSFDHLKWPVFHLVIQHSQEPEIARAQI